MTSTTANQSPSPLLSVRDLRVEFRTGKRTIHAVNGVSLDVHKGETLGILGESGSGKSITFEAVLGTLDSPPGRVTVGQVQFNGESLFDLSASKRRAMCGNRIGMIFQDPLSALNPVYTIGWQMSEMFRVHRGLSKTAAMARSKALLAEVGIPDVENRYHNYPHEFSGGMRQRLVIAMALAVDPELVIADEPTTALDVTVEAQILELMKSLLRKKGVGLVFITHSMGVASEISDRICVMYAGRVVETADVDEIFRAPAHPYTVGLMQSLPRKGGGDRLTPIPGQPPDLSAIPTGCPFNPRCAHASDRCTREMPALRPIGSAGHAVACHHAEDVHGTGPEPASGARN